jgi:hypothetical protein
MGTAHFWLDPSSLEIILTVIVVAVFGAVIKRNPFGSNGSHPGRLQWKRNNDSYRSKGRRQ